jgi:hypothetical protein
MIDLPRMFCPTFEDEDESPFGFDFGRRLGRS